MFPSRQRGSALMIALFVITIVALLAAAMSRFLVDSGEKNTFEVRGVRAQMAAESGMEVGLYQLFPNRTKNDANPVQVCEGKGQWREITFTAGSGLEQCKAKVECVPTTITFGAKPITRYQLTSIGLCPYPQLENASSSSDFAVSRTMTVEAYDE
jgi:MSHA biogenesis protein MshP